MTKQWHCLFTRGLKEIKRTFEQEGYLHPLVSSFFRRSMLSSSQQKRHSNGSFTYLSQIGDPTSSHPILMCSSQCVPTLESGWSALAGTSCDMYLTLMTEEDLPLAGSNPKGAPSTISVRTAARGNLKFITEPLSPLPSWRMCPIF